MMNRAAIIRSLPHTRATPMISWMEITLNPHARFHDGSLITAGDVAFTFHKFMTEGYRSPLVLQGTRVEAIAPRTVRITLAQPGKGEHAESALLPVMLLRHSGATISSATRFPPRRWPAAPIELPTGGWVSTSSTRG